MEVVGMEEILPLTADSNATFNTDFVMPKGATALEIYLTTADRQSNADWTASIVALTPAGGTITKLSGTNIVSNTTNRYLVMPGVVAVGNQIANEVISGNVRLTLTKSAGTYDFRAWAIYYK